MTEYFRPWKLVTLAIGIAVLIVGSLYYNAPDWDIPIGFIMAILAYLTAPWSLQSFLKSMASDALFTWFTIDDCYAIILALERPRSAAIKEIRLYGWLRRNRFLGSI